jgi:hypothetical protein
LACTQVAICGVWTIDAEEQNQNQQQIQKYQVAAVHVGARLPAIYRAAVAKSGDSILTATPHAQGLLPVRNIKLMPSL